MATTTRLVVLERLSDFVGDWRPLTTTSAGVAGGTTVVDTELANLTEDNGGIQGWVRPSSGTNSGEIRRIIAGDSGYTASTTTITVNFAFTNQVASGVAYELHLIDPTYKLNAIDRAIESLFPDLYIFLRDETLVVDNLLLNQDFETFSGGAFTNWSSINAPTVAAETSRVAHGAQSASVDSSANVRGIEQNLFTAVNINQLAGQSLRFAGWVWADTASVVRLRITFDGTTFTNGPFHGGSSEWEPPGIGFVDAAVPANANEMTVSCEVDGVKGYFDAMHAYVGPAITRYTLPTSVRKLLSVQVQDNINQLDDRGNFFDLSENVAPSAGRFLRLIGQNTLTLPTADTSNLEIDGEQVDLLVARAAEILAQTEWARTRDPFYKELQLEAIEEVARLLPRARMRRLAASKRFHWSQQGDSSNKFLILER